MSPEEELYDLACQDMPVTGDEVREALDKFKRAYAHELADKIRAAYAGDGPDEDNWIMNPYDAAALIDPGKPSG